MGSNFYHYLFVKQIFNTKQSALLLLIVILLFQGQSYGQTEKGIISGTVKDSSGTAIPHALVVLKNTEKGTYTNSHGEFILKNVPEGNVTIVIHTMGFETIEKQVIVKAGETSEVSTIYLRENIHETDAIEIQSNPNKFAKKESEYVARMPLENLENPQVYNVVSKELLQEQVVTNFNDAVKNVPGLDRLWESTGRGSDGAGYYSLRGFSVQPTMINGIAGLTNGGLDPANMERIEVIKGPSGTLYGGSVISFGGLINIDTKKPYETFGGELSYTTGGFGLNRVTADLNTPLTNNLFLRVNSAYHYENSFQDAGFKRSFFIAPSLAFKANERLSFLINTEYLHSEGTNPLMLFLNRTRQLVARTPEELNIDYNRSFTSNDVTIKNPTFNLYGQANYQISNKWVSQTIFATSNRKSDGYYQYVMFNPPGDSLLVRYVSDQYSTGLSTDIQQNFIGDFNIGKFRNRIVAGVDFLHQKTDNSSSAYITFDTVSIHWSDPDYIKLTPQAIDAKIAQNTNPTKNRSASNVYSAYVSDVFNINARLMAMLSLRVDHFDNKGTYTLKTNLTTGAYEQTTLSPKFGAVYQLIENKVSLFANYMNGFKNVAAATQPDGTVSNFKPQQAIQMEGGLKVELLNDKISGTISYYDINVSNIVRPDLNKPAGYTIQDGKIYSRGFEVDVITSPIKGLNIVAGYSYNESKNQETEANLIGRRPTSSGPQHLVNGWISYSMVKGKLKGIGVGFGGNYASENLITNSNVTGAFTLPAYTVVNGSVFYNTSSYRVALKVDNITDKQYWKGWSTVNPQMPRRVSANVTFKF